MVFVHTLFDELDFLRSRCKSDSSRGSLLRLENFFRQMEHATEPDGSGVCPGCGVSVRKEGCNHLSHAKGCIAARFQNALGR